MPIRIREFSGMYKLFLAISVIGAVVAWIHAIRATAALRQTEATVKFIRGELGRMKALSQSGGRLL